MTRTQRHQCHRIIHSAALAAGAGNLLPVPGTGVAADMVAMTSMSVALGTVFGADLNKEAARGLALTTLKNTLLKQPIRTLSKELSKVLPLLGQLLAPTLSAGMIEAAGWSMAHDLAQRQKPLMAQ
jgi:uncharacterized protein (DUF697 family)